MRVIWSVIGALAGEDRIASAATDAIKGNQFLVDGKTIGNYSQRVNVGAIDYNGNDFDAQKSYLFMAKDVLTLHMGLQYFAQNRHDTVFIAKPQIALSFGSYKQEIAGRTTLGVFLNGVSADLKNQQLLAKLKRTARSRARPLQDGRRQRSDAQAPSVEKFPELNRPKITLASASLEAANAKATMVSDKLGNKGVYVKISTVGGDGDGRSKFMVNAYDAQVPAMISMSGVASWLMNRLSLKKTSDGGIAWGEDLGGDALGKFLGGLNN